MESNNLFESDNGLVKKSEFVRPCVICHRLTNYQEYNYHAYVCSPGCLGLFEEKVEKATEENNGF